MRNLIITLLIVDILLIITTLLFGDKRVLLSSQVGFISSTLVIFGSFYSYKRMIKDRLSTIDGCEFDAPDSIDKIEDSHSLYDDNESNSININTDKSIDLVLKEEKERLKKDKDLKKSIKDSKNFFNPIKILSYLFLVVGFFHLNSNHLLNLAIYLFSLAVPIITTVWVLLNWELKDAT